MNLFKKTSAALVLAGLAFVMPNAANANVAPSQNFEESAGSMAQGNLRIDRVAAHSSDWFELDLNPGQTTWIEIDGDGYNNIDLYVYDMDGNLVAFDVNPGDEGCVWVRADFFTTVKIRVHNRGSYSSTYTLLTY